MTSQEAKDKVNSFPEGTKLRLTGYFDFPNRDTDRIGKVVSFGDNALTLDECDGTDLKVLNYDKILRIEIDKGLIPPYMGR
ncbi:hypothetical protein [Pseudomonas sp. NPDC089734]|uniref:hypothetical protein n=1 Tax=Pseudomonas sp. NPDC089734 TaxID=3364469 RepID=UPI0038234030